MNVTSLRPVAREAQRHPRKALLISLFALRHRKGLLTVTHATERVSRSAATARRVVANRKVQRETRLALSSMVQARERARKVGLVRAPRDKRLAGHLEHAGRHASKAMMFAARARRNRRLGRTTTVVAVTGAGALGGAAYAGWKVYGRPQPPAVPSPSWEATQPSADGEPLTPS